MTEMVERLARVLAKASGESDANLDHRWRNYSRDAVEIIEAMRDPSDEMIEQCVPRYDWPVIEPYQMMIDAALGKQVRRPK